MSIAENLRNLKKELPEHVTLVAVSKTKPVSDLMEAYEAGQRVFGENKIQEMADKREQMPRDIEWHMIGHVQRNKVKYMAEFVSLIHGVDSVKLLKEIDKQAAKHQRVISCLLQVHIAEEDTKFGMGEEEAVSVLRSEELQAMKHVKIIGFMGMATFTENKAQVKKEFQTLRALFDKVSVENPEIKVLSMGMSGDYATAIACGSTMVRIGSSIFGARNYHG